MNAYNRQSPENRGFTLSELLISLAILGLIATFTLSKLTQSVNDNANKARGKEAFAAINQVLFDGWRSGAIDGSSNKAAVAALLDSKLNFTARCDPDSAPPCNYPLPDGVSIGYLLPSGALISLYSANSGIVHFSIDANGNELPNRDPYEHGGYTVGDEIAIFWFNETNTVQTLPGRFNLRPGEMAADLISDRNKVFESWIQ